MRVLKGSCTEDICDNCYGPALGHDLAKVGDGGDSVCGGLFSGGPLETDERLLDGAFKAFDCPVRLQGGLTPHEGRVEVKYKGRWGTICSKNGGWDDTAATVLCNSLGYPRGEAVSCPDCKETCDAPIYTDPSGQPVCKYCAVPNTTTTCDNLVVKITAPSEFSKEISWILDEEPQPRQLPLSNENSVINPDRPEDYQPGGYMPGRTYEFELDGVEESKRLRDGNHSIWLKDKKNDGWAGGMDLIWTATNGTCDYENDGTCDAGTTECAAGTDVCDCGKCSSSSLGLFNKTEALMAAYSASYEACSTPAECFAAVAAMSGKWEVVRRDPITGMDRRIASGFVGFGSWDQLKLDFQCGAPETCADSDRHVGECKCSQECSYSECTRAPRFGVAGPDVYPVWLADVQCDGTESSLCQCAHGYKKPGAVEELWPRKMKAWGHGQTPSANLLKSVPPGEYVVPGCGNSHLYDAGVVCLGAEMRGDPYEVFDGFLASDTVDGEGNVVGPPPTPTRSFRAAPQESRRDSGSGKRGLQSDSEWMIPVSRVQDCRGSCVPSTSLGDGWCDDGNRLAKFNCEALGCDLGDCDMTSSCTPDRPACGTGQFQCGDDSCKPGSVRCNYVSDCTDGSDEENCKDPSLWFYCPSEPEEPISRALVNNGRRDCTDGADENANSKRYDNFAYNMDQLSCRSVLTSRPFDIQTVHTKPWHPEP